jgi:predicted nucleic acid-binding protein
VIVGGALRALPIAAACWINPLVYAEISIGFDRIEDLEAVLDTATFEWRPLPWEAAFLAGKVFQKYRPAGGVRRSPLPDFYIGAHAAIAGLTLLTRDSRRYRSCFPKLRVIAPYGDTFRSWGTRLHGRHRSEPCNRGNDSVKSPSDRGRR